MCYDKLIFDTPKPVELIKYLINLGSNANDIILDFFLVLLQQHIPFLNQI